MPWRILNDFARSRCFCGIRKLAKDKYEARQARPAGTMRSASLDELSAVAASIRFLCEALHKNSTERKQ
jgi:hypothetical protein